MGGILQDLRVGFRLLRKEPGTAVVAVLALALGIGLTTTMFGIIDAALLRGLPFETGDRIMTLREAEPGAGIPWTDVSARDLVEWRAEQRSFEGLAAVDQRTLNLSGAGDPERFEGAAVSANLFGLLRVKPVLGRGFRPEDDAPGAPLTVVLGYDAWRNHFGGDRDVLGRVVRVDAEPATVIGVMPPRFAFPERQQLWVPLRMDATAASAAPGSPDRYEVVGVLRPGVSVEAAQREMDVVAERLAAAHPESNRDVRALVMPYLDAYMGGGESVQLYTMLGAVLLVLLIACTNVANLLLGRAVRRTREIGVRAALGAGRGRVVALFLGESLALATLGAVAGLGIASAGMWLFTRAVAGTDPPFWITLSLDGRVLLFVLACAVVSTVAAGALPAFQAARADVGEILRDEARGSSGLRVGRVSRALVVLQIALSSGLLVGAGLMVKSVMRLRSPDFGFAAGDVFTARLTLPARQYPDAAARLRFDAELERRLREIPGVEAVALATAPPVLGGARRLDVSVAGRSESTKIRPVAINPAISPDFFAALDAHVLRGRAFTPEDRAGAPPVAIVNASFARAHFPGQNPLGKLVKLAPTDSTSPWRTVVGVVPDLYVGGLGTRKLQAAVYTPLAQEPDGALSVLLRARGRPATLAAPVRAAVAAIDPDLPIFGAGTLAERIWLGGWYFRVFGGLFAVFGLSALLLAAIGLYGVMATSVSRRTREMGVRMALGADAGRVLGLVLRQGARQVGVGMALGLALAFALSGLLAGMLFDVRPRDPTVFAGIVAVLSLAALAACLVPALRATKVDPMVALRSE